MRHVYNDFQYCTILYIFLHVFVLANFTDRVTTDEQDRNNLINAFIDFRLFEEKQKKTLNKS